MGRANKAPPKHEALLHDVHIASGGDLLGVPLAAVDETSRKTMAQQALRWTYVLRSRQRWVRDARVREQHQTEAQRTLAELGVSPAGLKALGQASTLVVRVPYQHEAVCWEGRIFPWEYVLAAATREQRRAAPQGPRPLTVIRELQVQHEVEGAWQPVPRPAVVFPAWKDFRVLFVNALPTELCELWTVDAELKNLAAGLPPGVPAPRVLNYPSLDELVAELAARPPHLLHIAGMDSHQGLRELGTVIGKAALVEVADPERPGRVVNQLVDELLADPRRLLDGLLLRGEGYPRLLPAQELAQALAAAVARSDAKAPPYLTTLNIWNSAARLAPMLIAEGATRAALGFQDAFDDSLAEYALTRLMHHLFDSGFDLPGAFASAWQEVRTLPESVDATGVTLWLDGPVFVDPATQAAHAARAQALPRMPADEAVLLPLSAAVHCEIKPFTELNYAVLHNAQPLFQRFVLRCDKPADAAPLDVEVAVHLGAEVARYQRRVRLRDVREKLTDKIHVPLTAEVARSVHEAINTSLSVRVTQGDDVLYHDSHRLRLLPVDQWRDNRRDGRWLPSFVLPRDPAVVRAVAQAQRYNRVLRDDPTAGFEGYQCVPEVSPTEPLDEDDLRGVDRQVEAIWATLLHDWQLSYINPPPSYSNDLDSQRLRVPSLVFAERSGTCIDLALLFAACLELVDIYPVIFLLDGHALPGWWRHPRFHEEYQRMGEGNYTDVMEANAATSSAANAQAVSWHARKASWGEIRRWIRERKLVPIETVRLTEHCSFIEAIESGVQALTERADYDSVLDIVTARQALVTPLPLLKETS